MWPMPLDDEFMDLLKSPFADIANVGGRWGGSITAALFLREFAESTPWIHLDIAGTASHDEGRPFAAKGRQWRRGANAGGSRDDLVAELLAGPVLR